jgi:predicted RNA binding protein YcfA (HicA-like mRNA interferase family)
VLYGLKQGAKNWYDALCKALKDLGFERSEADHGVFFKKEDGEVTIIVVHVDDCITTGTSAKHIAEFKANINKIYSMTDLGPAHWILGIKVTCDLENHTLSLSQHSYINSILMRYNFDDLEPVLTPMDTNITLSKSQCPTALVNIAHMRNVPYCEAVGSLMYAAMGTRPNIVFAMSTVA